MKKGSCAENQVSDLFKSKFIRVNSDLFMRNPPGNAIEHVRSAQWSTHPREQGFYSNQKKSIYINFVSIDKSKTITAQI